MKVARMLAGIVGGLTDIRQVIPKPEKVTRIEPDLDVAEEQEFLVVWRGDARLAIIERISGKVKGVEVWLGHCYVHIVGGHCEALDSLAEAYQFLKTTTGPTLSCAWCKKVFPADDLRPHAYAAHEKELAAALAPDAKNVFKAETLPDGKIVVKDDGSGKPSEKDEKPAIIVVPARGDLKN